MVPIALREFAMYLAASLRFVHCETSRWAFLLPVGNFCGRGKGIQALVSALSLISLRVSSIQRSSSKSSKVIGISVTENIPLLIPLQFVFVI
jgi:hypothetical protein